MSWFLTVENIFTRKPELYGPFPYENAAIAWGERNVRHYGNYEAVELTELA